MHRQLFQYHPTIGYHFIPGLRARVDSEDSGYLVRANQCGFRSDHEFIRQKLPGIYRVLLFGDSFTAGDMVSNGDRYGDVLESLIPSLEVYNFGLPGSGTDQQYLIYREIGSQFQHDLLVIAVLVENIRRVAARYRPVTDRQDRQWVQAKPYFTLSSNGELQLHNVPVPKDPVRSDDLPAGEREHVDAGGNFAWLRRAINTLGSQVKDHAQRLTQYQPLPAYDSTEDASWILLKAILTHWTDQSPVPVLLCPIPIYQYIEQTASPEGYQARFRELERLPRVRVHDPLPEFWKFSPAERRTFRFKSDPHLTPAGHRVLARSLASAIAPLLHDKERVA